MAESIPVADPHKHGHEHGHHHEPGFVEKYLWSTDHKMIAMQYMFTGMAMALIGGFFAYVFRMQLAFPGILDDPLANQLAHDLRRRHVARRAQLLEDLLLARIDQDGQPSGAVFHALTLC